MFFCVNFYKKFIIDPSYALLTLRERAKKCLELKALFEKREQKMTIQRNVYHFALSEPIWDQNLGPTIEAIETVNTNIKSEPTTVAVLYDYGLFEQARKAPLLREFVVSMPDSLLNRLIRPSNERSPIGMSGEVGNSTDEEDETDIEMV